MDSLEEGSQASEGGAGIAAVPTRAEDRQALASASYVYALGRVTPRFPRVAVEKEFAQVAGRNGDEGLSDGQLFQRILADRANRYLARQMCWVFQVEGIETYILVPRDPADFDLLIRAVRSEPRRHDVDAVIGAKGPLAPPEACNGLTVPIVAF